MDVQQFEQAVLRLAFETNARITPASVAYYLGIPSREANRLLNELLRDGVLELDSDLDGNLYYILPHHSSVVADTITPLKRQEVTLDEPSEVEAPAPPPQPALRHVTLVGPEDEGGPTALAPRRPPTPEDRQPSGGGADGGVGASRPRQIPADPDPEDEPRGGHGLSLGSAQHSTSETARLLDTNVIQTHTQRARRDIVTGHQITSDMETDASIDSGRSNFLISTTTRCEPKPLPASRPIIASCIDEEDEARARRQRDERASSAEWWGHAPSPYGPNSSNANALVPVGDQHLALDHIEQPEHQPGMALLLSLILCGTGQIYNGEVSKGIMMMVLCFLLWFVLLGWVIHIWSIVDAVVVAERINRKQHV